MDNAIVLWVLATLSTPAGMVLAVRLWVEYTAAYVDRWTGDRIPTFLYALAVSYAVVYGTAFYNGNLGNGMVFVDVFNGLLIAVAAGMLDIKQGGPIATLVNRIKAEPFQFTSSEDLTMAVKEAVAAGMESLKNSLITTSAEQPEPSQPVEAPISAPEPTAPPEPVQAAVEVPAPVNQQ